MNNNQFEIFENYTDDVCRYILSMRKKDDLKEEMYSHLLEEYDRNFALGLSHEEAQEKAISKMGDKNVIANQFAQLYYISPVEYMRSSLNFIIWGFILTTFHLGLFTGFNEIQDLIGKMLFTYGLFKLRKTDKVLNFALYFNIALTFYSLITNTISMTLPDATNFNMAISLIAVALNTILYGCIFAGTNNLCKTLEGKDKKRPKMVLTTVIYILFSITIVFGSFLPNDGSSMIIIPFVTIYFFIIIFQLRNAKNVLGNYDEEFNLKEELKPVEKVVYWVLMIVIAIIPIISMVAVSNIQPDASLYNPIDTAETSAVELAKENMLKLGFPNEYLKDLPNSEILKYKDAIHYEYLGETTHNQQFNGGKNHFGKALNPYKFQRFIFFLPKGEIRALSRIEFTDNTKISNRHGLYVQFWQNNFTSILSEEADFNLSLCDIDNKTMSTKALSTYKSFDSVGGFEFKFLNNSTNCRAYVSKSAHISKPTNHLHTNINGYYIYEEYPIFAKWQSVNNVAVEHLSGQWMFGSDFRQLKSRQLYDTFSYCPIYSGYDEEECTLEKCKYN